MTAFIQSVGFWIDSSKYVLLFLGAIVEGPVLMFTSGFLFRVGQFDLIPMYIALVSGDFVADIAWYCLGRYGTRSFIFKYGHFLNITPTTLEKVENRFRKYHQKILIISKLTMGFGFAVVTLIVAGIFKVPFKNYVVLNLIGGFIWTSFLLIIGYFSGNIFVSITGPEKFVFACSIFLVFILVLKFANQYLMKKEI